MPYVGFADILTWNHQFWKWIPTVCMNIYNAWSVMFKAGQYWDHLDQFYTCKVLAKTIWNQVSYKSLIPLGSVIFSLSEKNVHLNVISRQLFYSKLYFHDIFFFQIPWIWKFHRLHVVWKICQWNGIARFWKSKPGLKTNLHLLTKNLAIAW